MKYLATIVIFLSITLFACQNTADTTPKQRDSTTSNPPATSTETVHQDQPKDSSNQAISTTQVAAKTDEKPIVKKRITQQSSKEKRMDRVNKTKVSFPAKDDLLITADLYHHSDQSPTLVLLHQARSNRTEYKEMSPHFAEMGYNALAVDLRSGGSNFGGINETHRQAQKTGLPDSLLTYRKAMPDIEAAIDFAAQKYKQPIILVGSSYSAALALKVANQNKQVKAVAAFSPGEYFGEENYIASSLKGFDKPVFITGSQREERVGKAFFDLIESKNKTHFVPKNKGAHGARALWKAAPGTQEYWTAFTQFLDHL